MKKEIKYEDVSADIAEAIKSSIRVKDFLPPPEKLVEKEDTVRVTINLNKSSVLFF